MRPLVLTDEIRAKIGEVVRFAELNVISWAEVQARVSGAVQTPVCADPRRQIEVPLGFRCAFSMHWQRALKFRQLSVSVDTPGMGPNLYAMDLLAKAFGFVNGLDPSRVQMYVEQGTTPAVNVVEPVDQ